MGTKQLMVEGIGGIVGTVETEGPDAAEITVFKCLKYAEAPVGSLRFAAPVRKTEFRGKISPTWVGVTPAHSYGPAVWQLNGNATVNESAPGLDMFMEAMATQVGMSDEEREATMTAMAEGPPLGQSEDALTLTIRTPAKFVKDGLQTDTSDRLPVMVWIRAFLHTDLTCLMLLLLTCAARARPLTVRIRRRWRPPGRDRGEHGRKFKRSSTQRSNQSHDPVPHGSLWALRSSRNG